MSLPYGPRITEKSDSVRVEQCEAVVVLGGQHGVLHPEPFRQTRPLARREALRVEAGGVGVIIGDRDALTLGQHGVAADERPRQLPPGDAAQSPSG